MSSYIDGLKRSWSQHFVMQLATLTVLTASFTVVIFFVTLSLNFSKILAEWSHQVQITAYLKEDLSQTQIQEIESKIKELESVSQVSFVSQSEAMKRFSEQLSTYAPDLLREGGFEGSFPASFLIELAEGGNHGHMDELTRMAGQVGHITGVEDVSYGQGWVENYSQFVKSLSSLGWGITAVLLLGSMFVVGNSIRTSISQHRDEIEILELIGATTGMIRLPYVIDGAVMGALAVAFSLVINYGFYLAQLRILSTSWSFMGLATKFSYLGALNCMGLVIVGAGLGGLASYLTARNLNDGWAASQRVNV